MNSHPIPLDPTVSLVHPLRGAGDRRRVPAWLAAFLGLLAGAFLAPSAVRGAAATVWLPDYEYPARVGNYWVYDSVEGSGPSWTTTCRIESVNETITSYTGRNPIRPVSRRVYSVRFDQGDSTWVNYHPPAEEGWGYVGTDDEDDEVRFDPPFVITNRVAIGQTISASLTLYSRGGNPRPGTGVFQVLGFEDLTVAGQRFPGCLHLKLTFSTARGTQVDETWLAPGFGAVKFTHASPASGPVEVNTLRSYSYVSPPRVLLSPASVTNSLATTARLAAEVRGSTPLNLRWRRDGHDLTDSGRVSGTATTTLMIGDVGFGDAGVYSLVAVNAYGASTGSVNLVILDRTPPGVTVDSHRDLQLLNTASATLAGTASDAGLGANGIASVTVNGVRATGDTATGAGSARWSRVLPLLPGTNRIVVVAKDGLANPATNLIRILSDPLRPVVAVTSPTAGQRVLTDSPLWLVKGTAGDNLGLTEVRVQANGEPWRVAAGTRNWESPIHLAAGTNVVSAYSVDVAGNGSTTNTVRFVYVVSGRLALRLTGLGTVTGATNGQALEIGRAYILNAVPGRGSAFVNWTDGTGKVLGTKPSLTFTMVAGLTLVATFVDSESPTLTITSPLPNARILSADGRITVAGKAADNLGVTGVRFQHNGGEWLAAGGTTNWSAVVAARAGTNTVRALAEDAAGRRSTTNSVTFQYVVSGSLGLRVVGNGKVTGATNGQPLEIGRSYTVTAAPGIGAGFASWSDGVGSVLSSKPALTFTMVSGLTLVATFVDNQSPTLTITSPLPNARILSADGQIKVAGKAADNVGVTGVRFQHNGGEWQAAGGTTNWSVVVAARAGTNTVRAFAEDAAGRRSSTNSVTFQYVVSSPLWLRVVGSGKVTGATNGQPLEVGRGYTLTSLPGAGSAFVSWTDGSGSVLSTKPALTFIMTAGQVLVATFADGQKPTLAITSPTANQQITDGTWRVRGTAADNLAVSRVLVQLNGGAWQTASGTTSWEYLASLLSGPNTIAACAVDDAGNRSATNTVRVTCLLNLVPTYWPMNSGDQKFYEGPLGLATVSFSGGPTAFSVTVDTPEDSTLSYYEYGTGNRELLLTGGKDGWNRISFTPAVVELDADLLLKGGSRTTSFRIGVRGADLAATAKVTVSPAGKVTVPAGTYSDCRRVDIAITATIPGEGTGTFSNEAYILAPRVGMIRIGAYQGDGTSFRFLGWQDLTSGRVGGVDVRQLTSPSLAALAGLGDGGSDRPVLGLVPGRVSGVGGALQWRVNGVPGTRVVWESSPDAEHWTPGDEAVLGPDGSAFLETVPVTTDPARFYRVRGVDPDPGAAVGDVR